jgi:hypothetical protein
MNDNIKEFKIVVVASKFEKDCYEQLMRPAIRAIDLLQHEDPSRKRFKFIHNGVKTGPLGDFLKLINVLENGMRPRGYFVQRELRKMDLILNGAESEAKWVEENAKDADLILVISDGHLKPNVKQAVKNQDVYAMEIKV